MNRPKIIPKPKPNLNPNHSPWVDVTYGLKWWEMLDSFMLGWTRLGPRIPAPIFAGIYAPEAVETTRWLLDRIPPERLRVAIKPSDGSATAMVRRLDDVDGWRKCSEVVYAVRDLLPGKEIMLDTEGATNPYKHGLDCDLNLLNTGLRTLPQDQDYLIYPAHNELGFTARLTPMLRTIATTLPRTSFTSIAALCPSFLVPPSREPIQTLLDADLGLGRPLVAHAFCGFDAQSWSPDRPAEMWAGIERRGFTHSVWMTGCVNWPTHAARIARALGATAERT